MNDDWPFEDAPNAASITTTFILDGATIRRVYHDYDGGWQFHGSPDQLASPEVARLVSLQDMIQRDAALVELHDLPDGWCATRTAADKPWIRAKNNPFPTHEENGYYLEDAVWLSQYREDVSPPSEDLRHDLPTGTYVKLLFRFAAENAERSANETERMWVRITELDADENYVGTLENDPHNRPILNCGDAIHFHPLHVMEILDEDGA